MAKRKTFGMNMWFEKPKKKHTNNKDGKYYCGTKYRGQGR